MCIFEVFAGRELNPGWTLEEISIVADRRYSVTMRLSPTPGGRNLRTCVDLERQPTVLRVTPVAGIRVRVRGPEGADWRDAFRR